MSRTEQKFDPTIFKEEILKRISVSNEEFEKFLALWEFKKFKKNEFIIRAGEVPKFSIFVLKGCLRQYTVNSKGEESIVYFAEERHWIGDLPSMRNNLPTDFNFQAIEPCELLIIKTENWERSFDLFPWWMNIHLKGYQMWAAKMQQKMAEFHTKTGEERYLDLLEQKPKLILRVPQHFIASYLGLSPETLSRIRKKIAKG